jgi:2-polyprenyl-3-methyl-5-hydroxy-6-metoxy-1,4-benzoquinol methylase
MILMQYSKTTIGHVVLHRPKRRVSDTYADKGTEDILLELFAGANVDQKREEILSGKPSWPLYYHLNKKRANLLSWYEFGSDASVIEIGAGCGGITEVLVNKNVRVTALELAEKRALINAHRNKAAKNLEIVVGNLAEYKPAKKFDYAVCVGVLEYAGTFIHTKSPYEDFMEKISSLLVPGGKLLLAIENRFGLKYWAGAKEDHVHTFFEGHNGYPSHKKVQTFGRQELAELFRSAGYRSTSFYYPFPDYKNPSFVYSDSYYPGKGAAFPLGSLPTPTLDRPRETFFSEQSVMRYIEANGLFPDFSNSFLVEGTK